MARRKPYTAVEKTGQVRPDRVKRKSDVIFRRFECMSPTCTHTLVVSDEECNDEFNIQCPACGFLHLSGGSLHLFNYRLVEKIADKTLSEGPFAPTHDAYIEAAERVKYCVLCYTLQPLTSFDRHRGRRSQRQGECRMCKQLYNELKNESRLAEQHREAAETRRLLKALSGETKVSDLSELLKEFGHACFNCSCALDATPGGDTGYYLDHTLPVSWLWPLELGPTVLCRTCNGQKSDRWPSEFYGEPAKLRTLSARTGIPFAQLNGDPFFNPDAVDRLHSEADAIIERWVAYPEKLRLLRTRILAATGEDVFRDANPKSLSAIGVSS